jgi:chitin synthase
MGNRPTGSSKFYLSMVCFWAVIMLYLLFATVFVTVISVKTDTQDGFTINKLITDPLFRTLILGLLATWVMYLLASIIFLDPWHMLTCFVQYMLLTPTYLNILNVYAFCNTHDISWGTKGDDKAEKLGHANVKPGGKVDVNIPQDDGDLNSQYDDQMKILAQKPPKEVKNVSEADKQEDYYKNFRSRVVIVWMVSNLLLISLILSTGLDQLNPANENQNVNNRSTIFMAVILYAVAALSAFRFAGAIWFLIVRMVSVYDGFETSALTNLVPWRVESVRWDGEIPQDWIIIAFKVV